MLNSLGATGFEVVIFIEATGLICLFRGELSTILQEQID